MSCIVRDCNNVWHPKSRVKFHSFPKDSKRKKAWLSIVPLKGKFYESARICSQHFKNNDYHPLRPDRLIKDAVPFYSFELCKCCNARECDNMSLTSQTQSDTEDKDNVPIDVPPTQNVDVDSILKKALQSHITYPTIGTSSLKLPIVYKNDYTDEELLNDSIANTSMPVTRTNPGNTNVSTFKRRALKDFNVQANLKSAREISLEKQNKVLQQKVKRQQQRINDMKSLFNVVQDYTSQSEIENILQGNFAKICEQFEKVNPVKKRKMTYSSEIKAFALKLYIYSSPAYNFLREYISLPDEGTLLGER